MVTPRAGIRMAGPRTLFNVAGATNVLLYDQIAGRSCRITKITWHNAGAQRLLTIGTGVAGGAAIVPLCPVIVCPAGSNGVIEERELPALFTQAGQDIVGQLDLVSANDFDCQVEVEVIGA